jgi:DNA replication protein DnaC
VVSGDAGVGKTALIEAGASYAVSAGIRVLLSAAIDTFEQLGAAPWTARAAREL